MAPRPSVTVARHRIATRSTDFTDVRAFATPDVATTDTARLEDATGTAKFSRTGTTLEMDGRPDFYVAATDFDSAEHAFVVTTTQDNVRGSLRRAINGANGSPGPDPIDFKIPASLINGDADGDGTLDTFVLLPTDGLAHAHRRWHNHRWGHADHVHSATPIPLGPEVVLDGSQRGHLVRQWLGDPLQ